METLSGKKWQHDSLNSRIISPKHLYSVDKIPPATYRVFHLIQRLKCINRKRLYREKRYSFCSFLQINIYFSITFFFLSFPRHAVFSSDSNCTLVLIKEFLSFLPNGLLKFRNSILATWKDQRVQSMIQQRQQHGRSINVLLPIPRIFVTLLT